MSDPSIKPPTAHARSPLPLGHTVGGMRLLAVLGAGRFGIAYLAAATDEKGGQRHVVLREYMPAGIATRRSDSYAVRPLRASDRPDLDWGLTRLRQESEALAAIDHPSLARVFGLIEENGTGYLAEAYVEGQSLAAILERRGKLPEAEIRYVLLPLLDGLEQVHRVGLVHGGIQPPDIMFGREAVPILVGFGTPRPAPPNSPARGTETDVQTSWNPYAPHEIYDSRASMGPWTDIYGLGAVLYHAVTGVAPPPGPARVLALERGEPDPLRAVRTLPGYSAGLLAAIDGALNPVERERPQSLSAFRVLLARGPGETVAARGSRAAKADQPPLFDLETAQVKPPSGTKEGATRSGLRRRRAPLPDTPPPLMAPVGIVPKAEAAPAGATKRQPPRAWMWGAAFAVVIIAGALGWRQLQTQVEPAKTASTEALRAAARETEEAKRTEEVRRAETARRGEDARKAEEARRAEEARKAEAARADAIRRVEESRKAEEARKADEAREAEESRKAEEARKVEEARAERARAEVERAEQARGAVAKAEAAIARQDWREARAAFLEIERLAPDHAKLAEYRSKFIAEAAARVARADEAAARREWDAAGKLLDEAAAIQPDSPTVAAGRERLAGARRQWEESRLALERKADLLIGEGEAAALKFDFAGAADKLGEAEQALEGFPKDHPLRLKLVAAVAKVQRAIDDVEYERQRGRDADTYLVQRARADMLFDLAQKEFHEKKNPARACVLYRESGNLGHVGAQNQLGLCFATGRGVPKDEVEAYNWFRRAAEGGNAVGQFNLAHAFAVGAGVAKHAESALMWARKSAEQGYPKGLCRLGLLHRDGEGVAANPAEAAKLFRQGADKGDEWCMALLAEAYDKGTGVAKDAKQARLWYERAAAKGYEPAKARLKAMK